MKVVFRLKVLLKDLKVHFRHESGFQTESAFRRDESAFQTWKCFSERWKCISDMKVVFRLKVLFRDMKVHFRHESAFQSERNMKVHSRLESAFQTESWFLGKVKRTFKVLLKVLFCEIGHSPIFFSDHQNRMRSSWNISEKKMGEWGKLLRYLKIFGKRTFKVLFTKVLFI